MIVHQLCTEQKENLGLTIEDISERSGLSNSTVSHFFSPKSKNPSIDTTGNICRACEVSLDGLYGIVVKGMGQHEIDRVQAEHNNLEKKYRSLKTENQQVMDDWIKNIEIIERLESENSKLRSDLKQKSDQVTFLSYVESKSMDRIRWQKWVIAALVLVVIILGANNLSLDSKVPDSGLIQYEITESR